MFMYTSVQIKEKKKKSQMKQVCKLSDEKAS